MAVLFSRIGPYHFARLKAAARKINLTAVESSDVDAVYAWDKVNGADGFDRVTLFSGTALSGLNAGQVHRRVAEVLGQIQPRVVVIPGWYDRCSLAALRWCASKEIPVVVMSETTAWDERRSRWKEWMKGQVVRLCSTGLVGGSAHAQYLEELGIPRQDIFFGYDVVDNDYFAARAEECRTQPGENRRQFNLPKKYFLASARFVEKKNLKRLIRAYAQYRESARPSGDPWALVLLGDGPLRGELNRLISELGLDGAVQLPGFKQYHELPVYYAFAGAFIHASTTEQWGLVVNEAMASGLPVLVSNRCGCAGNLVREGKNGYSFNPTRVEEMARLMSRIAGSNVSLPSMSQESSRIMKEWSPERFCEGMAGACERALAKQRVKGGSLGLGITGLLSRLPENSFKIKSERTELSPGAAETPLVPITATPNFFIIGAPKSGTTALSEYLRGHPNIYFSRVKEPHFFDLDTSKRLKLSLSTYLSLFDEADLARHKAIGEGSTGYLFSSVAVAEILKFNPNAKFIVILRNPAELVQAWHSEMYFEGVEDVREFEAAWTLEGVRREGCEIPRNCWEPRKLFYSDWGRLGDQIERLFAVAERSQVKIIIFDDFVTNTKGVYEEILQFLEVESDGRTHFPQVNENRSLKHPWLQRTFAGMANYIRRARVSTGLNLSLGLGVFQKLLYLNSKQAPRNPMSPAMRAKLNDLYRADVKKLSALLGRDLSHWLTDSPKNSAPVPVGAR